MLVGRQRDSVVQGVHGELGCHPVGDGVADDPVAAGVFHRAQIELALGGGVFGDVGEPQQVWPRGAELAGHQIIVDGRSGSAAQATFSGVYGPQSLLAAQPIDPVAAGRDAGPGEFVGDEAVAEFRVVVVDVDRRVEQVRIGPVPVGHRARAPSKVGLLAETEHPAGHRDGNTVDGKVTDQRVHHFGRVSRAK